MADEYSTTVCVTEMQRTSFTFIISEHLMLNDETN